jgi:hypothetical protein
VVTKGQKVTVIILNFSFHDKRESNKIYNTICSRLSWFTSARMTRMKSKFVLKRITKAQLQGQHRKLRSEEDFEKFPSKLRLPLSIFTFPPKLAHSTIIPVWRQILNFLFRSNKTKIFYFFAPVKKKMIRLPGHNNILLCRCMHVPKLNVQN